MSNADFVESMIYLKMSASTTFSTIPLSAVNVQCFYTNRSNILFK